MPALDNIFYEFAALLLFAAAFGTLATLLRQPLLVAFIAVGIVAGPTWLSLITAQEVVELLAEMGIALLLFVVGLRLDLQLVRTAGSTVLVTGLGQILATAGMGFLLALLLGLAPIAALYVAAALTFSSTIITVKLLSDKREIDALYGRIALGILILQDLVVMLLIIGLSMFTVDAGEVNLPRHVLLTILKGGAFLGGLRLLMRFGLPQLLSLAARSRELLVLVVISWAMGLAAISGALGFSFEVGAFLAGVALASTPFHEAIATRLVSMRDFLLLFFFLTLGANLPLAHIGPQVGPALVLTLFVLLGKPLVVMALLGTLGYRKRIGFLTGLSLAQISEFSFILSALGLSLGHLDSSAVGLIALVGLFSFGLSTYGILSSHRLYERLARWPGLDRFERRVTDRVEDGVVASCIDVILFGLGRYGSQIARHLRDRDMAVLGIDFDPRVVQAWQAQGLLVRFGDAEDPEFPDILPLEQARVIVCAVPWLATNLALLHALRHRAFVGQIVVTALTDRDDALLREAGAEVVLRPFLDAAQQAADVLVALKHCK